MVLVPRKMALVQKHLFESEIKPLFASALGWTQLLAMQKASHLFASTESVTRLKINVSRTKLKKIDANNYGYSVK